MGTGVRDARMVVQEGPYRGKVVRAVREDEHHVWAKLSGDPPDADPIRFRRAEVIDLDPNALPSLSDALKDVIAEEINVRRPLLDGPHKLGTVSIIVYLDRGTGMPRDVAFRTEASRNVGPPSPRRR